MTDPTIDPPIATPRATSSAADADRGLDSLFDALLRIAGDVVGRPVTRATLLDGRRASEGIVHTGDALAATADRDARWMDDLAHVAQQALALRADAMRSLDAAHRTHAVLERLYGATPAMMHAVDADGRLLAVSDRWLDALGYARDDVIGRRSIDFMTDEARARDAQDIRPALLRDGRSGPVDLRMRRKDGSTFDVVQHAVLERDDAGAPLRSMSVFEDVTRDRAVERALIAEQAHMTRVLEGTDAGTWEWNVATGEARYNERWAAMAGYTLDELGEPGVDTWSALIHPDDRARSWDSVQAHFRGEKPYHAMDFRMLHKDGGIVWVHTHGRVSEWSADGRPLWMHGTHQDISDRIAAEEALRASENFLSRVGRVAGVGGWQLDLATGAFHWSDEVRRMHDMEPTAQPSIADAIRFYAPSAQPAMRAAVDSALATGAPWDLEVPFRSAIGRKLWVRSVGSAEFEDGVAVRLVGALQDVTARKALAEELAENRELLQVTLDSIADGVITTDTSGVIKWLNPVAERLTGWRKADAQGTALGTVFVTVDALTGAPTVDPASRCLAQGCTINVGVHTTLVARDGQRYGIQDSASPIRDGAGQVHGAVLVFRDVSEQRRLNDEMNYRATHDVLTGLVNRTEFEARLARMLESPGTSDTQSHAVLYIDLDQFKLVNDACGHSVGDQLLCQVSALLQGCIHGRDTLARLGGDEFGIILARCAIADAHAVAQQICDRLDEFRFVSDGRRFRVGASVGLVPVDHRWAGIEPLMQAADVACYAAKDAGRNRVHLWFDTDQAMRVRHGEMQWVNRIEQALDDDRFVLYGQRIEPVSGPADRLHCEVLLRMRDVDGTLVMPGAFLPAAERFHMATRIDRWVVRNVFARLERIDPCDRRVDLVAINLSGHSLGDPAFHREIAELIRRARFDVRMLCFEITETAAITSLSDARTFIEDMRACGVKIALDDFGAGASSFGYLKTLPVDYLKIDGHFVTDVLDDALDNAAVRCFCEVARVIGVRTIAEFVEREDVRRELGRLGVDFAQGYLIHRPEPLDLLLPMATALAA